MQADPQTLALRAALARPFEAEGRFAVWRGRGAWMTAPLALARSPARIGAACAAGRPAGDAPDPPLWALRRVGRGARQDLWRAIRRSRGVAPVVRLELRGGALWLTLWAAALDGARLTPRLNDLTDMVADRWSSHGWRMPVLRQAPPTD